MKVEIELNLKKVVAVLAVIAWVATFLQAFNSIWAFCNWPIVTTTSHWEGSSSSFDSMAWLGSSFLSGIIAFILTAFAYLSDAPAKVVRRY